jgi:hypothetical protein
MAASGAQPSKLASAEGYTRGPPVPPPYAGIPNRASVCGSDCLRPSGKRRDREEVSDCAEPRGARAASGSAGRRGAFGSTWIARGGERSQVAL